MADSAPYFHDGASPTLETAIARHHGNAQAVNEAYQHLGENERQAILTFLQTLKAPIEAKPSAIATNGSSRPTR